MSKLTLINSSASLEEVFSSLTVAEAEDTPTDEEGHTQEVTDVENLRNQHIRLASFHPCNCLDYEPRSEHSTVRTWIDAIADTEAVAISYAWGEFDRKEHRVGHYASQPQDPVVLTLGDEWSTAAFLAQLVSLSQEKGCWLDQICAAQRAEQISETLAAIPSIYMTLPVFVVLPGPRCGCLRKNFDAWERALTAENETLAAKGSVHTESTLEPGVQDQSEKHNSQDASQTPNLSKQAWSAVEDALLGNTCYTAQGCCSWPDRIWTFQETRYASQITILYADKTEIPCITKRSDRSDFHNWPGYLGCVYRRLRKETRHRLVLEELDEITYHFFSQAIDFRRGIYDREVMRFKRTASGNEDNYAEELLARRLLGEMFDLVPFDPQPSMQTLIECCELLKAIGMTATRPRDYVLSVFPGLPWYQIPPNAKSGTPFELMADAIQQLQKARDCFHPSTWPAGLFGASTSTAHWDLNLYCPQGPVKDCRDLYGPFDWSSDVSYSVEQFVDKVPFHILQESHRKKLMTFAEVFAPELSSDEMWDALTQIARYVELHDEYADDNDLEDFQPYDWNVADAEASLLDFACRVAHLDPDIRRWQKLQLMFCMQEIEATFPAEFATDTLVARIGIVASSKFQTILANDEKTVTVSVKSRSETSPVYEVVQTGKTAENEYAVVGIWLPMAIQFKCLKVEAILANSAYEGNALII